MSLAPLRDQPLAPLTSLGLGGSAAQLVEIEQRAQVHEALLWAQRAGLPAAILGGGTNLVVADAGYPGLVLRMATRGIRAREDGAHVLLEVEAGEPWQNVVDYALARGLAGLECLTGIPGSAGATPIQNVGAYGQEVGDSLLEVEVLERASGATLSLSRADCQLAYRDSRFKREPQRFVILGVRLRLLKQGAPCLRYAELLRALAHESAPGLQQVADAVRGLRAQKAMLLDASDANGRSAGSFFKNPLLAPEQAERVRALCVEQGLVRDARELPAFAAEGGAVKLSAAFLIEAAGFPKGLRRGAMGISSKHALALVHHGGGHTRELLALARDIQQAVQQRFGVSLELEPVCWGC